MSKSDQTLNPWFGTCDTFLYSVLLQSVLKDILMLHGRVRHFGKYSYLLFCQELNEKILFNFCMVK